MVLWFRVNTEFTKINAEMQVKLKKKLCLNVTSLKINSENSVPTTSVSEVGRSLGGKCVINV